MERLIQWLREIPLVMWEEFAILLIFGLFISFLSCDLRVTNVTFFFANYFMTLLTTTLLNVLIARIKSKSYSVTTTLMILFFFILATGVYVVCLRIVFERR